MGLYGAAANPGVGMGGSIRTYVPDTHPKVSLRLRVPPKGQGYPVGMPRSQNVSATGFTPTRGGTAEMQGFGTCRSQSAQIYVDYEQDAPVARCRERRAVSPMAASASVDKALAGWRTRGRHTNRCNADRVSLVGGRR